MGSVVMAMMAHTGYRSSTNYYPYRYTEENQNGILIDAQYQNIISHFSNPSNVDEMTWSSTGGQLQGWGVNGHLNCWKTLPHQSRITTCPAQDFAAYLAVDERFGQSQHGYDNDRTEELLEHIFASIRERDHQRPICLINGYIPYGRNDEWAQQDIEFMEDFFQGERIPGWNNFYLSSYIFRTVEGWLDYSLTTPVEVFAGGDRQNKLWNQICGNYRQLSTYIYDDYAEESGGECVNVESFLVLIQSGGLNMHVMREWRRKDNWQSQMNPYNPMHYRRPTRHEYRMHPYLGIACGARGIARILVLGKSTWLSRT